MQACMHTCMACKWVACRWGEQEGAWCGRARMDGICMHGRDSMWRCTADGPEMGELRRREEPRRRGGRMQRDGMQCDALGTGCSATRRGRMRTDMKFHATSVLIACLMSPRAQTSSFTERVGQCWLAACESLFVSGSSRRPDLTPIKRHPLDELPVRTRSSGALGAFGLRRIRRRSSCQSDGTCVPSGRQKAERQSSPLHA